MQPTFLLKKLLSTFLALACISCTLSPDRASTPADRKACAIVLNIRLADSPGPGGHPYAWTPWTIATGERPGGLALVEPENLLANGQTGEDGRIVLSDQQQQRVFAVSCVDAKKVWLLYPGQSLEMKPLRFSTPRSQNEEFFYLLLGAGVVSVNDEYSSNFLERPGFAENLDYARKAYRVSSNEELLAALRKLAVKDSK